jgi:hypothetical protein
MTQQFDGQGDRILRSPMFSKLVQELKLEVDVVDDVLASCAMPGRGRNTSTKLSKIAVCMIIGNQSRECRTAYK